MPGLLLLFLACTGGDATSGFDTSFDTGNEVPEPGGTLGGWFDGADLLSPLQENAVAVLDGELWVIGGFGDDLQATARIEAFNPATDSWRSVTEVPRAVHHAQVASVDGVLYVLGVLADGFSELGICWSYDPGSDTWDELAPMPTDLARGGGGTAVLSGRVHVVGGLQQNLSVALHSIYDPGSDTWTEATPMAEARDHLAVVAEGGLLYALGGRDGGITAVTDRVEVYDPASETWTDGTPMPTARGGVAVAAAGGEIYVIGGEGADNQTGVFEEVEVYEPASDSWRSEVNLGTPRHGTGAGVVEGVLWVPGGATTQGFGATAVHEGLAVE